MRRSGQSWQHTGPGATHNCVQAQQLGKGTLPEQQAPLSPPPIPKFAVGVTQAMHTGFAARNCRVGPCWHCCWAGPLWKKPCPKFSLLQPACTAVKGSLSTKHRHVQLPCSAYVVECRYDLSACLPRPVHFVRVTQPVLLICGLDSWNMHALLCLCVRPTVCGAGWLAVVSLSQLLAGCFAHDALGHQHYGPWSRA